MPVVPLPSEGIEHGAADGGDEPHQPAHQLDGLHGRMEVAARLQATVARVVAAGVAFLAAVVALAGDQAVRAVVRSSREGLAT
jgi:hypothetical protein